MILKNQPIGLVFFMCLTADFYENTWLDLNIW